MLSVVESKIINPTQTYILYLLIIDTILSFSQKIISKTQIRKFNIIGAA